MVPNIGRVGVWSMELRFGDPDAIDEAAAELDALGYGALWIPGGIDDAVLGDIDRLLSATKRIVIGTGIINIWKQEAADVAAWWKGQSAERQARVLLGIGISHGPMIGEDWVKPMAKTRELARWGRCRRPAGRCAVRRGTGSADDGAGRASARPARIPIWSMPATPQRRAAYWVPASCSRPNRAWCWKAIPPPPANWRAGRCNIMRPAQLLPTTGGGWAIQEEESPRSVTS